MPNRRSFVACFAVALLAVAGIAAPATASARAQWSAPVVVLAPPCTPDFSTASAAVVPPGDLQGFAAFTGGTCDGAAIWFFQGAGGRWARSLSPYEGDVLATAADRTGAWVLYLGGSEYDQVRLGRRSASGAWSAPRTPASRTTSFATALHGWTAGGPRGSAYRQRRSRPHCPPALAVAGARTWLAWQRLSMALDEEPDSAVLVGPPAAAPGRAKAFPGAGGAPIVAAATGRVAVAWSSPDRTGVVVASRVAGRWTLRTLTTGPAARGVRPVGTALTGPVTTVLVQTRSDGGRISAFTGH